MKRWRPFFIAVILVGPELAYGHEATDATVPPAINTIASQPYPQVTCTGSDPLAAADTLQLASDTRDQLTSLLALGPTWRFPVHIHIMSAGDPLLDKVDHEAAAVFSEGKTMKIEAALPSTDRNAREFIQRQFVKALLWEKFFAGTTAFDNNTRLDVVPMWLIEGVRESLNENSDHDRECIVRRAVKNQSTPTLEQVTHWSELSDDRLLGIWQRAFAYYLVQCLTESGPRLDDFHKWLGGFAGDTAAKNNFPTEEAWQQELSDAVQRSHDVVYTWSETLAELNEAETITYVERKGGKVQTCPIENVLELNKTPPVVEALRERTFLLTEIELRAHPSWHLVLELYRSALAARVNSNGSSDVKKLLEEAHQQTLAEIDRHQKLLDYVNWFEVTRDYSDARPSSFETYFAVAQNMERVVADPDHPNPIRVNLLQLESKL